MNNGGYNNEQFMPETVDEQVEQLSQISLQTDTFNTPDTRLIHNLYSISREYAATRDHVWHRLATYAASASQNEHPAESSWVQQTPHERVHHMRQEVHYPRRTHFQRMALVMAVLVAAVLVGSLALVFSLAQHRISKPAGQPQTSLTNTTSTYQPFCGKQIAGWDAGWYTVCTAHQEKVLDIVRTINENVIVVEAAYADNNRVMVSYAVQNVVPPSFPHMNLVLSTSNGTNLNGLGGSNGLLKPGTKAAFALASFDTSAIPTTTKVLNLHLRISLITLDGKKEAGASTIDFSLPIHISRFANLHQTMTVDGIPVTLDHVVVSPSETRLYVLSPHLQLSNLIPDPYSLAVNGWHTSQYGFDSEGTIPSPPQSPTPFLGVILYENTSLFNQQGQWTFQITSGAVVGGKGTWMFYFTVPAV